MMGNDFTITCIGEENYLYFSYLMPDLSANTRDALGVIRDEKAVGASAFSVEEGTVVLDYIYVAESERRQGLGTALFQSAAGAVRAQGIGEILVYFDDDPIIRAFLKKQGFYLSPSMPCYEYSVEAITASEKVQEYAKKYANPPLKKVKDLAKLQRQTLLDKMEDLGFSSSLLDPQNYDEELSFVLLDGETPVGVLLGAWEGNGGVLVSLFLHYGEKKDGFLKLLAGFYETLIKEKAEHIIFYDHDGDAAKLMQALLPKAEAKESSRGWSGILPFGELSVEEKEERTNGRS